MNVFDAIRARRSIRVFKSKPVPDAVLDRVLESARLAPSARNIQEWKFIVVRDGEMRNRLMEAAKRQSFVGAAPVVIVACATVTDYVMSCGHPAFPVDLAIAVEHMALQAVEDGLGTCWVCAFDEAKVKSLLGVPGHARVLALLPIGYPDESPAARVRKPLSDIVCHEKYS